MDPAGVRTVPKAMPRTDFGGNGDTLVFLHANGYPPDCYRPLLATLALDYHVVALLQRPLWADEKPEDVDSWSVFSDDLLQVLADEEDSPVIAMGHSLGATVALRAALRAPRRFVALILIEPVLFPTHVMLRWNLARAIGIGYRLQPMIKGALKRRRTFDSLGQVFESYRRRRVFRNFSDDSLRTCIDGMTVPASGGYRLVYPPEWEARVYYTGIWNDWDLWKDIASLSVPTLIIRGAESSTFRPSAAAAVSARNSRIRIITVTGASHLAPLERPGEIARLCMQELREIRQIWLIGPRMGPAVRTE
jgi:pimeloyl-ACP methyl ester carboxylesterase